jgi:hypothetical protein
VTDLGEPERNSEEIQRTLADLADLLLFPERFSQDPTAALESQGLVALPPEVVSALASLSPEELTVFAKVQRKIADVPGSEEIGIFF